MPTLYVTCPAYAMRGPLDRQNHLDQIAWLAREMDWTLVPSPLMERYLGPGAWLPTAERTADLHKALRHEAIWASRGGYGSIELVETVLKSRQRQGPVLIGYSDITALHAAFAVRGWGRRIYGAVPGAGKRGGRAGTSLIAGLRNRGIRCAATESAGARVLRGGNARGRLFPACLSVLASVVGTPAMPDLRGCVLAIEDIKVQPFLMATYLNQLHLSGALRGVRALLGGTFTHNDDADYLGPTPDEILTQWGERLRVPTIARLPFGHMDDSLSLPSDRPVRVQAASDAKWTVTINPAQ
ncbi:MAG: LD-carboxypeptidase [Planctomycetes bacterium]|nr:LD-carboxypeptidase [Planctomycetota bacterium]